MAHVGSIRAEELRRIVEAGKERLATVPARQPSGAIQALVDDAIRTEREHCQAILRRELTEADAEVRGLREENRELRVKLASTAARLDYWHDRCVRLLRVVEDQGRLLDASEPVAPVRIGRVS